MYGNETENMVTLDERYRGYVGQNEEYYIPRFLKIEETGKKASFNWMAFFFPRYWLMYRKMYWESIAVVGLDWMFKIAGKRPAQNGASFNRSYALII